MNSLKLIILSSFIIFLFAGCKNDKDTLSQVQPPVQEETAVCVIKTETMTEKITADNNENDPVYTISYTYPVISGGKAPEDILKKLNDSLKKEAEDFIENKKTSEDAEKAKKTARLAKTAGKEFYPHSSTVNYILQYNKNNVVSFLKAREEYTGGTNRQNYSEGITLNMETGNRYELSGVFEPANTGLIKILTNGFKTEASKNKDLFKDKTNFTEEEINNNIRNLKWYLSSEGIVFFFNPNTIVPGVNEILNFTYPYKGNELMFKVRL